MRNTCKILTTWRFNFAVTKNQKKKKNKKKNRKKKKPKKRKKKKQKKNCFGPKKSRNFFNSFSTFPIGYISLSFCIKHNTSILLIHDIPLTIRIVTTFPPNQHS